jgi:hypothetical protein
MLTVPRQCSILCAAILFTLSGCSSTVSQEERNRIVAAYSEILVARHLYPTDSIRTARAVDSAAQRSGYDGLEDFNSAFEAITDSPDLLREVLDSTQKRMERARDGSDTIPQTKKSDGLPK